MYVYTIWIEAEEWAAGQWDIFDSNTDVIVKFGDGSQWTVTIYTYKNIMTLSEKNKNTGEQLGGKYFWGKDMLLVEECSRECIEEIIRHVMEEGEFQSIFRNCRNKRSGGEAE
ncbi:MAG: hypothetical protein K0Q94_6898 [Paenibacillus sp.]|jgi:hypothetical protein|uniref:hypothetical protein n=1 Tax=Paenibacillus sp. GCM10012303 TaxID=3317340 RepID=UPI0029F30460|nr:hypothetical protein [Paenibacillus sp.]